MSPEFRLLCASCRWPGGDSRDAAVREAAADPSLDWQRVETVIRRHRVWGLAANALLAAAPDMPESTAARLREEAGIVLRRNLAAVHATARLGAMFDAAGIDWISFKGVPLALAAYGTLAVKTSNDVDILVDPAAVAQAIAVLREAGYVRHRPDKDIADDKIEAWMRAAKESGWEDPKTRAYVDLHCRMTANPRLLPEAGLAAPRERIVVSANLSIPSLGEPIRFAYLVAHGARDGWFRLKWLADIAALLAQAPDTIEQRYRDAQSLGVGRCAAQALLLAHDLLALPLPPALERELRANPIHRLLVRVAMQSLTGGTEQARQPLHGSRAMLQVKLASLLLRRGLGYKWDELAALAANPRDRASGRFPRGLGFLYPVVGGARWSARMLGLIGRS